jgi:hypothetical protein
MLSLMSLLPPSLRPRRFRLMRAVPAGLAVASVTAGCAGLGNLSGVATAPTGQNAPAAAMVDPNERRFVVMLEYRDTAPGPFADRLADAARRCWVTSAREFRDVAFAGVEPIAAVAQVREGVGLRFIEKQGAPAARVPLEVNVLSMGLAGGPAILVQVVERRRDIDVRDRVARDAEKLWRGENAC